MKEIILSEEEARAIHTVLKRNWVQNDLQKIVYGILTRIEKELGIE